MFADNLSLKRVLPAPAALKKQSLGLSFFAFVALLIGSSLYSTVSWMWDDQRLPLSKIVLQGNLHYVDASQVQNAFGRIDHIGTFMSQDIAVLQKSVETIPWVAHASIRKQWPDVIKVFITEHHPRAIWNGNALLNDKGLVFDGDIHRIDTPLVRLSGPVASSEMVLSTYRDVVADFTPLGLTIHALSLNDRRAWQLTLSNGVRLELGKDALKERIKRFVFLYRQLGEKASQVAYVDLRYDTGAAIGWRSENEKENRE